MGLGKSENDVVVDDGDGGGGGKTFESVPCSICLEGVSDNGDRSLAKLQCGHQFHLDCIGSAFNIKGSMQCPNCRKIEKGQWLYANGVRSLPEFSIDDWVHDEDLYDLGYSEMSFGVHWCPYGTLTRLPFFEEGEFPPNAYHVTSTSNPCPYVAYFGPFHPSSSTSSSSVSEGPTFNNIWNNSPNEIPSSYGFPAMDLPYRGWDPHSPPFSTTNGRDQPSARSGSDLPRPGPFMHPFIVGHGSSARAGSSVGSSMVPPYQGSNARARDRIQALQAYYQQQPGNPRRSTTHRGSMPSSSDQTGIFWNLQDPENPPNRFRSWDRDHLPPFSLNPVDRDPVWGPFHRVPGGSDPGTRRQRHASQNRS